MSSIKLPSDVYFIHDLIGCKVFDSKQKCIGELVDVAENGGNDLYIVKKQNNEEVMIPAVSKFVISVSIKKKEIHINEIPGLIN